MSAVLGFLRARTIYALILLLALFVVGVEIVRPGTVTLLWASNTILFAAPLAIMAGGQTLVMLTGGIDLSVASVATGAAYLLATNASSGAAAAIGLADEPLQEPRTKRIEFTDARHIDGDALGLGGVWIR